MDDPAARPGGQPRPDTDLVEYLMIVVPQLGSLDRVVPALAELVRSASIRIMDLVCLTTSAPGGPVSVADLAEVESIAGLQLGGEVGGLFSEHDVETASLVLPPGSTAILLMVEDRWAESLSAAAKQAGGRVAGGGRIARQRIEAALTASLGDAEAILSELGEGRGRAPTGRGTGEHPDLLAGGRPESPPLDDRRALLLIDAAAQMTALADLVDRGLVSPEEFERQRHKVFGP